MVRGVMGGVVWVGESGRRCRAGGVVMGCLLVAAGGRTRGGACRRGHRNQSVGPPCDASAAWSRGGGGWFGASTVGGGGGRGRVLCSLGVWASRRVVWVLHVRAVRSLWSLAGCGAEVRLGGGRLGIRAGLWSVGSGWLPVDGASWHGVWVGWLLVVVGCSL